MKSGCRGTHNFNPTDICCISTTTYYIQRGQSIKDKNKKKKKINETETERNQNWKRDSYVVSRISAAQPTHRMEHGASGPTHEQPEPEPEPVPSCDQTNRLSNCPSDCPSVRLSVCPSIWATPKRAKANRALPKLTRSKMSDGLIGLNAGKIYLSTLVGFGFCLRSYTWAAGQQLLPLHTHPSPFPHLPSLLICPTPFWLLIYLALSKTELIVASL